MIPTPRARTLPLVAKQTFKKITPTQKRWIERVLQGDSDVEAYRRVYRCKEKTALANAYRLRKHDGVMMELIQAQARLRQLWIHALAPLTKKGSLVKIMMEGKDSDCIRAIKELNVMEEKERLLGGGQGTEFDELVVMIARKRRALPFQDADDRRIIELEQLPQ